MREAIAPYTLLVSYWFWDSSQVVISHFGWHLHEMAPFKTDEGELARMTVQGHAIKCDRGWIVHW